MMMGGGLGVSLIPMIIIGMLLIVALLGGLFVLLSPILSIAVAVLLPIILTLVLQLPISSALILFAYEALVILVLYLLKKRKTNEISKW